MVALNTPSANEISAAPTWRPIFIELHAYARRLAVVMEFDLHKYWRLHFHHRKDHIPGRRLIDKNGHATQLCK